MEQKRVDPDFFGGKEDRAPWGGLEGRNIPKAVAAITKKETTPQNQVRKKDETSIPIFYAGLLALLIGIVGWSLSKRQ